MCLKPIDSTFLLVFDDNKVNEILPDGRQLFSKLCQKDEKNFLCQLTQFACALLFLGVANKKAVFIVWQLSENISDLVMFWKLYAMSRWTDEHKIVAWDFPDKGKFAWNVFFFWFSLTICFAFFQNRKPSLPRNPSHSCRFDAFSVCPSFLWFVCTTFSSSFSRFLKQPVDVRVSKKKGLTRYTWMLMPYNNNVELYPM